MSDCTSALRVLSCFMPARVALARSKSPARSMLSHAGTFAFRSACPPRALISALSGSLSRYLLATVAARAYSPLANRSFTSRADAPLTYSQDPNAPTTAAAEAAHQHARLMLPRSFPTNASVSSDRRIATLPRCGRRSASCLAASGCFRSSVLTSSSFCDEPSTQNMSRNEAADATNVVFSGSPGSSAGAGANPFVTVDSTSTTLVRATR